MLRIPLLILDIQSSAFFAYMLKNRTTKFNVFAVAKSISTIPMLDSNTSSLSIGHSLRLGARKAYLWSHPLFHTYVGARYFIIPTFMRIVSISPLIGLNVESRCRRLCQQLIYKNACFSPKQL